MTLHLGAGRLINGGGKAMRAINKPGSGFLGQEGYLIAQKSAVCGSCCGCTDIRRGACEYQTDTYTGTAEHRLEFREALGGYRFEMEIVPGLAIGVWKCGVI